jgi:hypothetical protein
MLEARAPEIRARHLWGLISVAEDPRARLPDLLGPMKGAFYLVLRPSAPMIYNFRPSPGDLQRAAASQRLELEEVDHLDDARGNWARLYAVRAVE